MVNGTHPCQLEDGTYDHDWVFHSADPEVGINAAWICENCAEVDDQSPPPDESDYDH